jgi:asparagine synthase (glutamine-hydrolysing)
MCGLLGGYFPERKQGRIINQALAMIKHRGPDSFGYKEFTVSKKFLYLGHTRLSIIDLTEAASQPLVSSCGDYSLIFNGEIYNYLELKSELEMLGYDFKTQSDTEVLLNALIEWGVDCLVRTIGMFSFVFHDHRAQKLTLVRDAFGIKPIFYESNPHGFLFASELRPLLFLRGGAVNLNFQRSYDYLVHGDYDSSDECFVQGVRHLPAAHYCTFDLQTCELSTPKRWWNPSISPNLHISFDDAVNRLRELFLESVKLHLRSDVPIGVALSGGVDSSAIVSAIRYLVPTRSILTFSYVADDDQISEEKWIDLLNTEMKATPHKAVASHDDLVRDLDEMLVKQGEPFGSTSVYAQYRVYKLARECGVTVMLDGQGADELLAGYSGYPGHRLLSIIETQGWLAAHRYAMRWMRSPGRSYLFAWEDFLRIKLPDAVYRFARKLRARDFQPSWLDCNFLKERGVVFSEKRPTFEIENKGQRVKEALLDSLRGRGLSALLRHSDRNSMAVSIESRVPFLTVPLAEFLLSLPESYLVSQQGVTKHVFREAMRGIVPDSHLDRMDKIGFATPEANWTSELFYKLEKWIITAPSAPFINKDELMTHLQNAISQKKTRGDSRVWRAVSFLRWLELIKEFDHGFDRRS